MNRSCSRGETLTKRCLEELTWRLNRDSLRQSNEYSLMKMGPSSQCEVNGAQSGKPSSTWLAVRSSRTDVHQADMTTVPQPPAPACPFRPRISPVSATSDES